MTTHTPTLPPDPSPAVDARAAMATLLARREDFLNFLARRTGDRALAEDLLQEAFARGLDRLDTLRDGESATAWFYRVLRTAVIDHRRRNATAAKALDGLTAELDVAAEVGPAEPPGATCRCVSRVVDALKPEYAAAIKRVEVEGTSVKDYAAEAGITANNAAVRVFRAREALRARVRACCGRCADAGCADCTCAPHPDAAAQGGAVDAP